MPRTYQPSHNAEQEQHGAGQQVGGELKEVHGKDIQTGAACIDSRRPVSLPHHSGSEMGK
jgi:hypothetical protein